MIHIKEIKIDNTRFTMLSVIKKKKKTFLYLDGVKVGRVKSYKETVEYIRNNYVLYRGVEFPGRTFSVWVKERVITGARIYSRALKKKEIKHLYKERK